MAEYWTNKGKADLAKVDFTASTMKVLAVSAAPASAAAAADLNFVSDVVANELTNVSGTGYVRKTLSGLTIVEDDTNDRAFIDCNDFTYTAINAGTIAGLWVYRQVVPATPNDAADILWCFLGAAQVTNGGDINVAINALGLSTIS